MRPARLALLVLAVGAIAWLVARADAPETPSTTPAAAPSRHAPKAMLRGAAPALEPDSPAGSAAEAAAGGTAEKHELRVVLPVTLRVEGANSIVPFDPPATIGFHPVVFPIDSIFDFDSSSLRVASSAGRVELDVSSSVHEYWARRSSRGVDVTFLHPDYLPLAVRIPLPGKPGTTGTLTLDPVELVLRRATQLRGRVLDLRGQPCEEAAVFLYAMSGDGPERVPVAEAHTDDAGRFEISYGTSGTYLVVALWSEYSMALEIVSRHRPASAVIDLDVARSPDEVVLSVQPSWAVSGRVLLEGLPPKSAWIAWSLEDGKRMSMSLRRESFDMGGLVHLDGEVHWGWDDTRIKGATFTLPGLSRRPYRLSVKRLPGALLHAKATQQVVKRVTPPADVLFDVRLARLHVEATLDGAPMEGLHVRIASTGMDPDVPDGVVWDTRVLKTDAQGHAGIAVSPECRYFVATGDIRFRQVHEELATPAAGETHVVRMALERARPKPRLLVTLTGEGAQAIERAGFGFYPPEKSRTDRTPWPVRSLKRADGRFVLDEMHPGRYRMHVRPGRTWDYEPNEWIEATRFVEIPQSGDVSVQVEIARGGRLHVTVTDPHGRHLEAACTIRDGAGEVIPAWFSTRDPFGQNITSGNRLPGAGASWVEPVLPPGRYTLVFSLAGFREETRPVELKAGEATTVRVEMKSLR